jgi:hypothetical protein
MKFNSIKVVLKAPYGVKHSDMWLTFIYTAGEFGYKVKPIYKPSTGCNYSIDATDTELEALIALTRDSLI